MRRLRCSRCICAKRLPLEARRIANERQIAEILAAWQSAEN